MSLTCSCESIGAGRTRGVLLTVCILILVAVGPAKAQTDFSGHYTGTYNLTNSDPSCTTPLRSNGPMTLDLTQQGSGATGSLTLIAAMSYTNTTPCQTGTVDESKGFAGTLNGSTLSVMATDGKLTFNATFTGDALSGSFSDPRVGHDVNGTFNLTRTASTSGPAILSFTANPSSIGTGGSTTLSWSTQNATSVTIDLGVGSQPASGSVSVSPTTTTTYTLTASGSSGTSIATATVTFAGPEVTLSRFPSGMLQLAGSSSTDSFTLTNVGSVSTSVTASANGSFFSVDPPSFTLGAGSSQIITINASSQPPGSYSGSVGINGSGVPQGGLTVPVTLAVTTKPTGPVDPQPANARIDLAAPIGQNPTTTAMFTNNGTATVTGIAVANAPWITVPHDLITIGPGQSVSLNVTIDRSHRPDASALAGGVEGRVFFVFFNANASANAVGLEPLDVTPPSPSSVSVTIVDVVKPGTTTGAPSSLQPGELAYFIAGLLTSGTLTHDLFVSNLSLSSISDLKIYNVPASGSPAQVASPLPSITTAVAFPSVAASVFGSSLTSSVQLRSANAASLSVAALRSSSPTAAQVFTAAVPVFRSDRGAAPGDRIVLPGVSKSTTDATAVILQELSGNTATADIQAYDANGAPTGAKTSVTLAPFGMFDDGGAIVAAGSRSVVVTNTGSSSRLNAYARVVDSGTGDAWILVDPTKSFLSTTDTLVMPLFNSTSTPATTDLFVTNSSAAPVSVTLDVHPLSSIRRRPVNHPTELGAKALDAQQLSPLQTLQTRYSLPGGYVRITAPTGTISASSRVTMTIDAVHHFGSAITPMPVSAAVGISQTRRFTGVEDAAASTVAAHTPGTSKPSLVLIEVAGQPASVHVTLSFSFVAGDKVSATESVSGDFPIAAGQMLVISNLVRTIAGPQRDSFGDLLNMTVDVSVASGSGQVIPYLESIDSGSADLVVRSE